MTHATTVSRTVIIDCLQPFIDRKIIAGAVTVVADQHRILSLETLGYSDLVAQKPMTPDAYFWIASNTKPMTATAMMMLVDEGKVNLEDPVEKYLPIFRNQMMVAYSDDQTTLIKKPSRPVTVKDLLSHLSGLPGNSHIHLKNDELPLREAALSYAMTNLGHEPGSKYVYSNPGINTAGRIMEVVTNTPFETFMQTRLLDPLGMKDTTFFPTETQLSKLAKTYRPSEDKSSLVETPLGQFNYPLTRKDRYAFPGGGYFSTAMDVTRFAQMILRGGTCEGKTLLSRKSVRQMTTTKTDQLHRWNNGSTEGYGLGWKTAVTDTLAPDDNITALLGEAGHGGALGNNMWIDPRHGLVTVLLVQCVTDSWENILAMHNALQDAAVKKYAAK